MPLTRFVASAAALVAVMLGLAGCALLPGATHPVGAAAVKPTVGECWNANTTQASDWADWEGPAATACAGSHTLYTYDIGKISGETASSWASPSDPTSLTDAIQTKAEDACKVSTLLPGQKWNQQLITAYFFVPTEQQWMAGDRWVRCDVGVLATGTTLDNESFVALPSKISTLVTAVSTDPARFEFCMNSRAPVTQSGPLDNPDATLANCKDHPQWTLATHGKFPDGAGAPFPDDAASNAASSKVCLPAVKGDDEIWTAYLPTKSGWASGDREIDCWIGDKSVGGSGSGGIA
jgi:Septum formation